MPLRSATVETTVSLWVIRMERSLIRPVPWPWLLTEADPHLNRGTAEEALQDWQAAAEDYLWILERDPSDAAALYNLGNVRGSEDNWSEKPAFVWAFLVQPGLVPAPVRRWRPGRWATLPWRRLSCAS